MKNKHPKQRQSPHGQRFAAVAQEKMDVSVCKFSPSFDQCEALLLSEFDRIFPCALSPDVDEHDNIFDEELSGLL